MTGLVLWVIASTILLFVGAYWLYVVEKRLKAMEERYQKILALAEDTDQATIVQFLARLDGQEKRLSQAEAALRRFGDILPHTIQGHGVVRYSAFENVGGDQSFSLALVDAHGNAVGEGARLDRTPLPPPGGNRPPLRRPISRRIRIRHSPNNPQPLGRPGDRRQPGQRPMEDRRQDHPCPGGLPRPIAGPGGRNLHAA